MGESDGPRSTTYGNQGDLKRLPIPTLEETLEKLPRVLEGLQNEQEQEETKKIVEEFKQGDGPKLQSLLKQYDEDGAAQGTVGSYVEEFWNDSYLAPDQSVVLNLNPFFVLQEAPDPKTAKDQICRAASLVFASLKFASLLKSEELRPDVVKGKPLCMDQFKALFGSCRVPQGDKDCVAVYPDATHVVVLSMNQLFYFQALWPNGTVAVDEADIRDILAAVRRDAAKAKGTETARKALGVLTSLPRKEWADARETLVAFSASNAEALNIIDSALFVVVLDDIVPRSIDEAAANMLHGTHLLNDNDVQIGTCCNRWYDKLQIIVCADGTAGINFEHSAIDGHTALRLVSDIYAETVVNFAQSITKGIYGKGHVPHVVDGVVKRAAMTLNDQGEPKLDVFPKKLVLHFPSSVLDSIFFAETALGDEIVATDTVVLEFKKFGKLLVVSNKMSPDSFVQMSIILAYFSMYGKMVCAYEPVLTKQYYHGRTEAMRSATPAARELCRVWVNKEASNKQKLDALRAAVAEHSRLVKESAVGKGVDRHLFALKCVAQMNNMDVPAFFKSHPWTTLNHTVLSTSNCGNPSLRLFGFGPVVPDGFGIGYIIKDSALQYSVSSRQRQTQRYARTLERTLLDLKKLLNPGNAVEVGATKRRNSSLREVKRPVVDAADDAYGDIWGESSASVPPDISDSESSRGRRNKFTRYFPFVRKQKSVRGSLLTRVGQEIDLDSKSNGSE